MRSPRARAIMTRRARSNSPESGVGSAPAGTSSGPVLCAGFVLGARLVRQLGEVQAVHEVAAHGEALFVDDGVRLFLSAALQRVRLGDDARGPHPLSRDA